MGPKTAVAWLHLDTSLSGPSFLGLWDWTCYLLYCTTIKPVYGVPMVSRELWLDTAGGCCVVDRYDDNGFFVTC